MYFCKVPLGVPTSLASPSTSSLSPISASSETARPTSHLPPPQSIQHGDHKDEDIYCDPLPSNEK